MTGLVPLQVSVVTIAGTFAAFALFLSVTAHIAARNVLGDVPIRNAFGVGPLPAGVAFVFTALEWPSFVAVVLAVALDAVAIKLLYKREARLTAYVTVIHVVVSIILGVIVFGVWTLALSAPT
jgi:hypothetical protein